MSSNRLFLTFLLHPVLIVFPSNAIQFANKVGEPGRSMICLSSPIMCSVGWWPWSMFICAWEVYRPWEGCMRVFAIFQARRRTWEVFITTFLRGTIDFKVVWLMQFWFTMASFLIWEPVYYEREKSYINMSTCIYILTASTYHKQLYFIIHIYTIIYTIIYTTYISYETYQGQSQPGEHPAHGFVLIVSLQGV